MDVSTFLNHVNYFLVYFVVFCCLLFNCLRITSGIRVVSNTTDDSCANTKFEAKCKMVKVSRIFPYDNYQ